VPRERAAFDGLSTSALTLLLAEPDASAVVEGLDPASQVLAAGVDQD
jgi:hypothetical protein